MCELSYVHFLFKAEFVPLICLGMGSPESSISFDLVAKVLFEVGFLPSQR